ncbi:MAG TPA: hypothetical protein VIK18_27230, partial [Pirellulales bacterium]
KPAAEAPPAEPVVDEVPLMTREFLELREYKGPDGVMLPIELNRSARTQITRILNDGKFTLADDEKLFDDYYRFRIAELTWTENLTDLPKKRGVFKKNDLSMSGRAAEPEVHAKLNKKLLDVLPNIALKDAYHPVVRFNCMLLLGTLDQTEPAIGGVGALPLPEALVKLKEAAADAAQIDAVRIAAMDGILRHCELEVAAPMRKELVPVLQAIIAEKKPSAAGTPAGQLWLRHRAAQALTEMAAKWPEANQSDAVNALQQLVADEDAAFIFRADAAQGIGTLQKGVFKDGPALRDLSTLIGRLAIGIATKAPVPDAGKVNSENLTYCLLRANAALKGQDTGRGLVAAAVEPSTRKFVTDLANKIDGLISTANDQRLNDSDRTVRLADEADRLNQWLEKSRTTLAGAN